MLVHKNILKDLCRLIFWYPFRWFVLLLPFAVAYRVGGVIGYIDYYLSGRKRVKKICTNISEGLGINGEEAEKVAIEYLRNYSRNMLELMKYPQLNRERLASLVHYEGIEYLNTALEKGKGVILLTAHFGAKQFMQVALGLDGYPLHQINFHMSSEELSYVQKQISQRQRINIEKRLPLTFIPAKGFMRPAFECLKKNEILIVAGDGIGLKRHMDMSYLPFDFLGKKMLFPVNAADLAKRTGASIIPILVIREGAGHKIVFEPPLNDCSGKPHEWVKKYVLLLEKYVRRYPYLWDFWEEFDQDNLLVA
jgi:KDO2-lipid IV(A) lauroyltransferase